MKNKFWFVAMAAIAFSACNKIEEGVGIETVGHTIKASMEVDAPETRTAFDQSGALYWIKGDDIAVLNTNGGFTQYTLTKGEGTANATFTALTKIGMNSTYALHPFSDHEYENSTLTFNLPESYTYAESEKGSEYGAAPMIAVTSEQDASNFYFKHLGGAFCFTIKNIPADVTYFKFEADEQITGNFTVTTDEDEENVIVLPTSQAVSTDPYAVTINFPAEGVLSEKKFFIPLPVGTIDGFRISLGTDEGESWNYISTAQNTIVRRRLFAMPDVTINATVDGSVVTEVATAEALIQAMQSGSSVKLTDDISLSQALVIGDVPQTRSGDNNSNIVIDLNGKTLSTAEETDEWSAAVIVKSGNVVIKNGTIATNGTRAHDLMGAIWVRGTEEAHVTIESGTFKGNSWNETPSETLTDDLMATIYVSNPNGSVTINDGEFHCVKQAQAAGQNQILNYKNGMAENTISVTGGTFYGMNPEIGNGVEISYVADGYSAVETTEGVFEVREGICSEAALKAAIAAGGSITLSGDITLDDYIEIRNEVSINLNGHNIVHPATSSAKYPDVFEVYTNGKLELNGNGKVEAENGYAIYAAGDAVVIINGGEYLSPVSAVDARKDAQVTINGGTFKVDGSNNPEGDFGQKYTLNLRDKTGNYSSDKSQIIVKGGKFYNYDPAASESEPEVTNFVATGYSSVKDGDYYVVSQGIKNEAALKAAVKTEGTVQLGANITLTDAIKITKAVTIDLNGYTIENKSANNTSLLGSVADECIVFYVDGEEANLTLNATNGGKVIATGDGETSFYNVAVWTTNGATTTINGGEYYNTADPKDDGCDLIYGRDGGKIYVTGGTFKAGAIRKDLGNGIYGVLNCKDSKGSTITVSGGKFYEYGATEASKVGNGEVILLAEDYKWTEKDVDNYYSVVKK